VYNVFISEVEILKSGINTPRKMKLTSEGLINNGFLSEKWFEDYSMYIQSRVKDESRYIWLVTVGKDPVFEDEKERELGRIYIVIQDPLRLKPSLYFTIKSFGHKI